MGDWLPGAREALKQLDQLGTVVIHTCRVAPFEFHEPGREVVWRDELVTAREVQWVKAKLAAVGLAHIEVWTRPYKPPALVYIDDRAVPYQGNWADILEHVGLLVEAGTRFTFGGNEDVDEDPRPRCPYNEDIVCPVECATGCQLDEDRALLKAAEELAGAQPLNASCCPGCPMCEESDTGPDPQISEFTEMLKKVPIAKCDVPYCSCGANWDEHRSQVASQIIEDETFIGIEEYEFEQRVTDGETGGQKGRKLARFALIPAMALRALARHYGIGALKYDDNNWLRGYDWDLSIDALHRHLNAWERGESVYLERFTGRDGKEYAVETHHLIAVAWQAFTLYVFEKLGLGRDTRAGVSE